MVKACLQLFGLINDGRERRRRRVVAELEAIRTLSWDLSFNSKDISVRVVHAGGCQELYANPVPASQLMKKYPGMCIARPDVFKHPRQSLMRPDEKLVPGQKYYVIPCSTFERLKRKDGNPDLLGGRRFPPTVPVKEIPPRGEAYDSEDSEDSFSSAKNFYVTGSTGFVRTELVPKKKRFVPPLPQSKLCQSMNWEPSLDSVQEISL